jgi:UDP-N-acetylmuramyl pentapeptide phosphotransferase/UDP-N-acetylglucosamine-1-phosphate transferase
MIVTYIISTILLLIAIIFYFRIADHFNIIDNPNERSSHSYITIRGGGIIFLVAALIWFFMFGFHQPWIILALILIAIVSFIDDLVTLSSKVRILIHFAAVTLLFWQLQVFVLPWYGIVLAYLFTIGWINAFNFMDGINGITPFYTLVTLVSFWWVNQTVDFISEELIILLVISLVIFSFFNARKQAKTFPGDVGSVSLAFLLAWFMITLMIKTGRVEYILFFSIYGVDSIITIIYRLKRRENIFKAHRSHLYQYLSNELKWPHVLVSVIYGVVQFMINVLVIWLLAEDKLNILVFCFLLLGLASVYLLARYLVSRTIRQQIK